MKLLSYLRSKRSLLDEIESPTAANAKLTQIGK